MAGNHGQSWLILDNQALHRVMATIHHSWFSSHKWLMIVSNAEYFIVADIVDQHRPLVVRLLCHSPSMTISHRFRHEPWLQNPPFADGLRVGNGVAATSSITIGFQCPISDQRIRSGGGCQWPIFVCFWHIKPMTQKKNHAELYADSLFVEQLLSGIWWLTQNMTQKGQFEMKWKRHSSFHGKKCTFVCHIVLSPGFTITKASVKSRYPCQPMCIRGI